MSRNPGPIRLTRDETAALREALDWALRRHESVLVWVDSIDKAFKIKYESPLAVWSPPMGTVAP